MTATVNFKDLTRIFGTEMSPGDRSCVVAMLDRIGAQQATTAGSPHCRFYELLASAGWARQDTGSALTAAAPFVRVWELTEQGRATLQALMPILRHG